MAFLIGDYVQVIKQGLYSAFEGTVVDFSNRGMPLIVRHAPDGCVYEIDESRIVLIEHLIVEQMLVHPHAKVRACAHRVGQQYVALVEQ